MAKIILHEGEDITSALKRFNKKVLKDDILNECRKREFFMKPSDIRKEKARRAKKKQAAARRKNQREY